MYFFINDPAQVGSQSQFDVKLCNVYHNNANIVIETKEQYLSRVPTRQRFIGSPVTMLFPKEGYTSLGSYPIKTFASIVNNFEIKYYTFIDGLTDIHFVEIPKGTTSFSIVGKGLTSDPFMLENDVEAPGANKYYGTGIDGLRGWQPTPEHHDPVTIGSGSESILNIDANQVLTISLPPYPEQVNADWNAESGPALILNKPDLSPIPATTISLGSVIIGAGLSVLPDGTVSVNFPPFPEEIDPTVSSYTKGLTSATIILNEVKSVDGHLSGLDADLLDGKQASDFADALHKHYQLYQPNNTNPFVYTDNSAKLFVDGSFQTQSAIISNLIGTGTRLSTISSTGAIEAISNSSDGTILALASGIPTWTSSIPTIKLSSGAVADYYWKCTNSDGSGVWAPISTSQVYKGTIDGSTGIPIGGSTALIDGTGTAGWYYRAVVSGTYDYGNPSGNSITLAIGDDIYYNGTIWQKIPGQGYTLQPATSDVLGGVKIGSGVTVQVDGTISVSTAYRPDTWVPLWSEILNKTTTDITEGTNLFFTEERTKDAVGAILQNTTSVSLVYDDNLDTIKATVLPGGVDHNSLLNYVANRHIDHSLVSIIAGTGLNGGGDLTSSRTLNHNLKTWVNKTDLSGATVISNLTIDSTGHPTDWTTRTLTAANIGAEPTVSKQNVTAGSNKITLGGAPNSSVFSTFSIDVNEANLSLNNLGGILSTAKGGTGLSILGTGLQLLRVNNTATALEYFTPTYLTSNQNITWTGSLDVSGTSSGTTNISVPISVIGIQNKLLPTLSIGYLRYTGSAWEYKNEVYSLDGHSHTQYLTDAPSDNTLYGRKNGLWEAVTVSGANNYTTGISFNTSTGTFTLNRSGLSDLTTNLDGRYSLIHSHPYEPILGNPIADGYLLSSTAAGVRSWVPNSASYTHPTQTGIDTGTLSGANVISRVVVNTLGHTTTVSTRALTLSDLGYNGSTSADNYSSWNFQSQNSVGTQIGVQAIGSGNTATIKAGSNITLSQIGGIITISSADTNTTYSNGTALELSGTTFNHLSYVTAGTISGSSGAISFGGTIYIPSVTYNAQGHITGTTHTSITLPANPITSIPEYLLSAVSSSGGATIRLLKDSVVTTPVIPINGSGATSISWDGTKIVVSSTDSNWYPTSMSFTSGTGILQISGVGMTSIGTSLDGRYSLTSHTHGEFGKVTLDGGVNYYPLHSGSFYVDAGSIKLSVVDYTSIGEFKPITSNAVATALQLYQPTLVSGTNIKTINGSSILGSGNLSIPTGTTTNAITFNNSGSGAASGTTFDGSVARTISYNTIGAAALAGSSSQAFSVSQLTSAGALYLPSSCNVNSSGGYIRLVNGSTSFSLDSSGNGNVDGTMTADNFILSSDRNLKENIKPIETSHTNMEFVEFNMKGSDEKRYGVIAQQVEETHPELVRTNEDGKKSVAYIDLLILKIAELEARIKILENGQCS